MILRRFKRRSVSAAAAVILATIVALVAATGASAHAVLVATTPTIDSVLAAAPTSISLRFDEPVGDSFGSLRVFAADGHRIVLAPVEQPRSDTILARVPAALPRGTYVVSWRVVSADTHPVHGAFVFSVGARSAGAAAGREAAALQTQPTSGFVHVGFAVVRFLAFALLLLAAGGAALLASIRALVGSGLAARLYGAVAVAAAVLVPVSLLALPFQGAWISERGIGAGFEGGVLGPVLHSRFGEVWSARAVVAALLVAAAVAARRYPSRLTAAAVVVPALGLVVSPAAAGHADAGVLAFLADVAHVAAGAAWTGGLAFVVAALVMAARGERWKLAAAIVPRFSTIAVGSVAVLLGAGLASSYFDVGISEGLWTTTYGQLLLAKVGLVLVLLLLGAYNNRRAVPRLRAGIASVLEQRRFLRATGAELSLFVAVVAVTAVLVQEPTAKSAVEKAAMAHSMHAGMDGMATMPMAARTSAYALETRVGPFRARVAVQPARPGPNEIRLEFRGKGGMYVRVAEATVSATLPAESIGPMRFAGNSTGTGRFVIRTAQLPMAGTWRLLLEVRRGDFDEWTQTISIPIRMKG